MAIARDDQPWIKDHEELSGFQPLKTPIWIFDVDRHCVWWANPSGLTFWEADSLDALLARDFSSDNEIVRTRLRQIVANPTGSGRVQETWTLYPHGHPTTVILDFKPIMIDDGRHAVMIEASYPLDLKGDPEALRILEAARSSPLLVSSFTLEGQLLAQNPASAACYPARIRNKQGSDLAQHFADRGIRQEILAAIEEGRSYEAELTTLTAAGARTHRVSAHRGRDPVTGEFIIVLNEEDISEQVALRSNLERLNNELEARVAERTARLQTLNESLSREIEERQAAEQQLRQAQKMEAIGRLTGGVAHDFNNLLSVIMGHLELIASSLETADPLKESADIALKAVERGGSLTRQLLAFARQQPLRPRDLRVDALMRELVQLVERSLGEDVSLDLETGDWAAWARVDPSQLQIAMVNLVLNARDALADTGGRITVTVENTALAEPLANEDSELPAGNYVGIQVADTGSGMSEEVRRRAFDPFFTTKEVGAGSGLGLSMVFGFIRQSGGHIAIDSAVGEGTRISILLPTLGKPEVIEGDAASEKPTALGGRERILVLEDDQDVRAYLGRVLGTLGYRIVQAANGREALALDKRDGPFDLLLSDLVLSGGMNGPEVADRITARHPDTRVLFISGYSPEMTRTLGAPQARHGLLHKPFNRDQLATAIRDRMAAA